MTSEGHCRVMSARKGFMVGFRDQVQGSRKFGTLFEVPYKDWGTWGVFFVRPNYGITPPPPRSIFLNIAGDE